MKVTFCLPEISQVPMGGYKIIFEYANRLQERGHKVTIVFLTHNVWSRLTNNKKIKSIVGKIRGRNEPSWFHLNSKGYFKLPTIREFIDERYIKIHFFVHLISIVFFILSYFENNFIYMASLLVLISNILFFINCLNAVKKYSAITKTDPMDLSVFK